MLESFILLLGVRIILQCEYTSSDPTNQFYTVCKCVYVLDL